VCWTDDVGSDDGSGGGDQDMASAEAVVVIAGGRASEGSPPEDTEEVSEAGELAAAAGAAAAGAAVALEQEGLHGAGATGGLMNLKGLPPAVRAAPDRVALVVETAAAAAAAMAARVCLTDADVEGAATQVEICRAARPHTSQPFSSTKALLSVLTWVGFQRQNGLD